MPAPAHDRPLLAGHDLDTYYGQSHILRGVTLTIRPGETIGLMGRNGMGKTTLIRTLVGLVRARRGSVLVDGENVTRLPTFAIARRGIAYVPEGRGIFASLSVAENLAIAGRGGPASGASWTAARVLELFPRLAERLTNRGDQLSGGEQQMLAIGRALMARPAMLLLDEPSLGIAPRLVADIFEAIARIAESGTTILLVEQNTRLALKYSTRAYVLRTGEIAMTGPSRVLAADDEIKKAYLGG